MCSCSGLVLVWRREAEAEDTVFGLSIFVCLVSRMSSESRKKKSRVKWSKIYSFRCFQPEVIESPLQQFGGPGFTRTVFCNQSYFHRRRPFRYSNNSISTTKYNFATFFPKALFEQFRRVANLYFLLAAVISLTPLAPFSPVTAIAPLVLVVGISMAKEALEDCHRFMQVTSFFKFRQLASLFMLMLV